MRFLKVVIVPSWALMLWLGAGCKSGDDHLPSPGYLAEQVALGEQIFLREDCGACHSIAHGGEEFQGGELSALMLAMDTLYVKKHLQTLEDSTLMPPIPLTPQEISAVTQYIASLHGKANTPVNLKNLDDICPVCGAPLSTTVARKTNLWAQHGDKTFYFECPDCRTAFLRDPKRFSKSGYLKTK